MSKRVYEIAREQSLETKEVMERLKNAGVEVKNHFAVIEDPVVDGIFGGGQTNAAAGGTVGAEAASNGQPEASVQAPAEGRESGKKGGRKRRRVVIDASATNRGPRPVATGEGVAPREPRPAPDEAEEKQEEKTAARVEP
ncbi:MAG: translation initiation factor IF-2 N-terminal domain-containing protein, partial [Actinobacteria bacterium]|nr:translation initiation factor IF-2 N-terminal domain-containing protein [Actinomycetota bacterium]